MTSSVLAHFIVAAFPVGAIAAALSDAATFTIPNRLTIAIAAAFFPVALILGLPVQTIGACAAVGVLALVVGVGLFAMNWCGGGDAKLLAACALWLGVPAVLPFLFAMSVVGGILALILVVGRKTNLGGFLAAGWAWLERRMAPLLERLRKALAGPHGAGPAWLGRTGSPEGPAGPVWVARLFSPTEALPYGIAIAVGALIAFPSSPVMQALGGH